MALLYNDFSPSGMAFHTLTDAILSLRFPVALRPFHLAARSRPFAVSGKGGLGGIAKRHEIPGVSDPGLPKDLQNLGRISQGVRRK